MINIEEIVEDIHEKRVLVIDDCEFVAQHVAERLDETYSHVDYLADSTQAFDKIIEVIDGNNPYQTLVLDLDMPVVNGVQLLKTLSENGIHIPTVLFSGEQGDYIAIKFIHQMSKVRHREELDSLIDEIEKESNGLPITYLRKFEGEDSMQDLVNAIDAVTIISQRRGADLSDFLSRFPVSAEEYHYENNHLTQMADIVKLMREGYIELREKLTPHRRFMKKKEAERLFKNIDYFINNLAKDRYSIDGLSDPEMGRSNIHLLQPFFRSHFLRDMFRWYLKPQERLLARYRSKVRVREIESIMEEFETTYRLWAQAFDHHRIMSKDYTLRFPFRIDRQLHGILEGEPTLRTTEDVDFEEHHASKRLYIDTNVELFSHVLINILFNAVDAVRDSDEKKVYVESRRTRVSKLPREQREYFAQLGYDESHPISRVLVRDTGCGIPPEIMDKITVDGFSTKGSTGFGLSFVDNKIGEIPGTYRIISKVGEGTDFYLYFPIASDERWEEYRRTGE